MMVKWMDVEYTDAPTYYKEVVMTVPRRDGIILGGDTHLNAIALLTTGGLFVVEIDPEDIYVDDWRVNGPNLSHKHPEFGLIRTGWTEGVAECDIVHNRTCSVCAKVCPGEIEMMHKFYQL